MEVNNAGINSLFLLKLKSVKGKKKGEGVQTRPILVSILKQEEFSTLYAAVALYIRTVFTKQ